MSPSLSRLGAAFERLLGVPESLALQVGPGGPRGEITVPNEGDGRWLVRDARGQPCLSPDESSYYLYFALPAAFRERATQGLWVEVDYQGARFGEFRLQYASRRREAAHAGLYEPAEQRWDGEAALPRRALAALGLAPD